VAVTEPDGRTAAELIRYFKAHARRVHARLHVETPENLRLLHLDCFPVERGGCWEGMTSELYDILKDRSVPGLPNGSVPFGKWLRTLKEEDGISVEEGHRGKSPIVKLCRSAIEVEGDAVITDAQDDAGTESPTINTSESTEGNNVEGQPEIQCKVGPYTVDTLFADEDEQRFNPARIDRIREVVQENWNYRYEDPQILIDEEVFYGLGFDPSRAEVEEAQRPFVESIG